MKDAFVFMRELMLLGAKLVGKPTIERLWAWQLDQAVI
jgi:hypothetical protein